MYAVIRRLTLRTSLKQETDLHSDHHHIGTQSSMRSCYMSQLRAGIGMVEPYHYHLVLNQVIWMFHLSSGSWSPAYGPLGQVVNLLLRPIKPYLDNDVGHGHIFTTGYTSCELMTICEARIGPLNSS